MVLFLIHVIALVNVKACARGGFMVLRTIASGAMATVGLGLTEGVSAEGEGVHSMLLIWHTHPRAMV